MVGTAAYLSPEQALGQPPGSAADIYSLGLVILECFTRERAFPGTLMESVAARLSRDPAIPDTLPRGWLELLQSMTDRDPAARPAAIDVAMSAHELGIANSASLTLETERLEAARDVLDDETQAMSAGYSAQRTVAMAPDAAASATAAALEHDRLEPTRVLTAAGANVGPAPSVRDPLARAKRPFVLVIVALAGVLLLAVIGTAIALSNSAQPSSSSSQSPSDRPSGEPSLAPLDDPLSDHVQELLDEVSD